jgi:deoxyribose-phosphate aldolase
MVVDLGAVLAGDWEAVEGDVAAVRAGCGQALLKVIIETAALSPEQIMAACRRSEAAGADYVKTSTGFHPAGGASVEAVGLMRATVGDRLGVKASGGIRDTATAIAMLDAGASRLGMSATRAVLDGLPD